MMGFIKEFWSIGAFLLMLGVLGGPQLLWTLFLSIAVVGTFLYLINK
jgi:hypothetical protein